MISGGFDRELGDALEDVLRRVRREVGDQLVVDGQVRRQDEEVSDAVGQVQVGDEGAHQPRLADAGGQREAERRELALEVRRPSGNSALDRSRAPRRGRRPSSSGTISQTRSRISSDSRCGGRRLRRPAMALTCRFMLALAVGPVEQRRLPEHRDSAPGAGLLGRRPRPRQVRHVAGCSRPCPTRSAASTAFGIFLTVRFGNASVFAAEGRAQHEQRALRRPPRRESCWSCSRRERLRRDVDEVALGGVAVLPVDRVARARR